MRNKGLRGPNHYDEQAVLDELNREYQQTNIGDDPDAPRSASTWKTTYENNYKKLNVEQKDAFDSFQASYESDPSDPVFSASSWSKAKAVPGRRSSTQRSSHSFVPRERSPSCVLPPALQHFSSRVASQLTAHSAFHWTLTRPPSRQLKVEHPRAHRLFKARVIIIDEFTMLNKDALDYIDKVLQAVCDSTLPFGGKIVCISGDWKQFLPVIEGESAPGIIAATARHSRHYDKFRVLKLKENMRAGGAQEEHRQWLRDVGNGRNFVDEACTRIAIPEELMADSGDGLIEFCFPSAALENPLAHARLFCDNAVVCPTNLVVDKLNKLIASKILTESRVYTSLDKPMDTGALAYLSVHAADRDLEVIHSKTAGNLPPHLLELKVGLIVMCTQNLSLREGLCNGTRMQVVKLLEKTVVCKIITGVGRDKEVVINPVRHTYGNQKNVRKMAFERLQLPIKPAAVMTQNKSQGQTTQKIGIYLAEGESFSHGGIYVALSRATSRGGIRVFTRPPDATEEQAHPTTTPRTWIRNVVWPEVLDEEDRPVLPPRVYDESPAQSGTPYAAMADDDVGAEHPYDRDSVSDGQ